MRKISRSTKATTFRPTAIQQNRHRIARNADGEEQERLRLVLLNKKIERANQPVIQI